MDQQANTNITEPTQVQPVPAADAAVNPSTPTATTPPAQNNTAPSSTPPAAAPTMPTGDKNKKLMMLIGLLIVFLFLIGGVVYVMGVTGKTRQLGLTKTTPYVQQKPTIAETSAEEKEAASVDTGDPEEDLKNLETDYSSLE